MGLLILLLVDFIWVASSELTEFIFKNQNFRNVLNAHTNLRHWSAICRPVRLVPVVRYICTCSYSFSSSVVGIKLIAFLERRTGIIFVLRKTVNIIVRNITSTVRYLLGTLLTYQTLPFKLKVMLRNSLLINVRSSFGYQHCQIATRWQKLNFFGNNFSN